jgi:hypothetical protein
MDSVALTDSAAGEKTISGSGGERLEIRNMGVLDSGEYRLEARNGFGKTRSVPVRVQVDGPPAIAAPPTANFVVREGGMLILSPRVAGSLPLTCVWKKDGKVVQVGSSPTFQRARASRAFTGKYVLTVTNRLGAESSSEISVLVQPF